MHFSEWVTFVKSKFFIRSILILTLLLGSVYFLFSPKYQLNHITYRGNALVSQQELVKFSKKYQYKNIFYLQYLSSFKKRMLTQFEQIKSLSIKQKGQSQLEVTINEKKPWLAFLIKGENTIISKDGTILIENEFSRIDNLDQLLIIKGVTQKEFNNYKKTPLLKKSLLNFVKQLKENLPLMTMYLEKDKQNEWIIWKDDQLPIKIGKDNQIKKKCQLLKMYFKNKKETNNHKKVTGLEVTEKGRLWEKYESKNK